MKLISMTDFVLESISKFNTYESEDNLNLIIKYAKFLKQPLKLEMFVPCDNDGNILEKPSDEELWKFKGLKYGDFDCNYTYIFDYNLAKEKVFFEGFDLNQKDLSKLENIFCLTKEYFQITFFTKEKGCFIDNLKTNKTYEIKTIEDLIEYDLQLTETAIKQIGL